ncbi:MAG: amidase [Candidatus Velthaea sp.]
MIASHADAGERALARIATDDATLQAWAYVATSPLESPAPEGPLAGVSFGVKDIIDVAGMPTAYGLWREHRKARLDAWCVALLRAAGAVPIGKTRTTAHAYRDPAPTINPLDHARTPGGSSAGSAAAVAARHVDFALGTQTIGSILRPAGYCGVVGFKGTWGCIPVNGVAPFSPSLDHVGVIGIDVAMTARAAHTLVPTLKFDPIVQPRIALADSIDHPRVPSHTRIAVAAAIDKLRAAGIAIVRERLPESVDVAPGEANLIAAYEAHVSLAPLMRQALPTELHSILQHGKAISREEYVAALERRSAARPLVDELFAGYDAVVVPGGDAAPSRASTGDGTPFAAWSYFGMPAISIPIPGTAPAALSLQLVAPQFADGRLLALAATIEAALA